MRGSAMVPRCEAGRTVELALPAESRLARAICDIVRNPAPIGAARAHPSRGRTGREARPHAS
jgi:hypothetical protein